MGAQCFRWSPLGERTTHQSCPDTYEEGAAGLFILQQIRKLRKLRLGEVKKVPQGPSANEWVRILI